MPARKKSKIVRKPKRIRPKFTLSGVKKPVQSAGENISKETVEKVEEKQGPEDELTSVVESPTSDSAGIQPEPKPQEPFIPVNSASNTVQPSQTQFLSH